MSNSNDFIQKAFKAANKGNRFAARKSLLKALKLDPKNDSIFNMLGLLCLDDADHQKASKYFRKAVELAPANPFALNNYGVALTLSGEFKTAITYLRQACKIALDEHSMTLDLANALLHTKQYEQAIEVCEAKRRGRPRTTDLRDVFDAILYIASSGCQWRMLPNDFPSVSTVRRYFYDWRDNGLLRTINHYLVGNLYRCYRHLLSQLMSPEPRL